MMRRYGVNMRHDEADIHPSGIDSYFRRMQKRNMKLVLCIMHTSNDDARKALKKRIKTSASIDYGRGQTNYIFDVDLYIYIYRFILRHYDSMHRFE
jgi:hypothetical protein